MGDCISNTIKRLSGLLSTRRHLGNETVPVEQYVSHCVGLRVHDPGSIPSSLTG
jgi:hypothetical protein